LSVVIDANALVVLALDRKRAPAVERRLREWQEQGEELHAPALLPYEIANALTRAVADGQLAPDDVGHAWRRTAAVPVVLHELDDGPAIIELAQRLERRTAYDAAYLLLAERMAADLWTLDGPLARNAQARGLPAKLIGTSI
jgi:predicted nucleic acid-binding protein